MGGIMLSFNFMIEGLGVIAFSLWALVFIFGNSKKPDLVSLGGGVKDLEIKVFKNNDIGDFLRVHLFVDTKDAMGANTIDTIVEAVAPLLEKITGSKVILNILV